MSLLVAATGIEKAWGGRPILKGAELHVEHGDRVGLVGPNGCGKSTLLRIIAGLEQADSGRLDRRVIPSILEQDPTLPGETVGEAADAALGWHSRLITDYEAATIEGNAKEMARLQGILDLEGWEVGHRVDAILDRLGAPPRDAKVARLSGGEKRRVALARALLGSPDLLLLDEPTNHLDLAAVEWLQDHLAGRRGGLVLVTHDRYLLEAVVTQIVEVERGICVAYEGSYTDYLVERAERQARQSVERDKLLSLITREAAWAAKSPAARTTKQKARLQRLDALKEKVPVVREREFSLDLRHESKLPPVLMEMRGITHGYGGRKLIDRLDLDLERGTRLGILGANGAGKSTLLRLIAGTELPNAGRIERTPRLKIAILDQARTGLDPTKTLFEAAGDGNTTVFPNGEEPVHVASFLGRFLFQRDQFEQKVAGLSGGERARLLLARLLLHGANLLLLDEPTNDLDLLTLCVLEEALLDFDGAAVIVTHDRAFLDRTCTAVLAFEGEGRAVRYAERSQIPSKRISEPRAGTPAPAPERKAKVGLSWKEQQELTGLPARIEVLEAEQAKLETTLADPATWWARAAEAPALQAKLAMLEGEVRAAWARWEALEARREG